MKDSKLLSQGVNVLIDGQWGSTGKGKLAAYLADHSDLTYATADFQPNAGHTVRIRGKSHVVHCIPGAFVNLDARLYLNAASTISVPQFMKELEDLTDYDVANRIRIHPHAGVVTPEDVEEEKRTMTGIASTMQGTGAALARKIRRQAKVAKDVPELRRWISDELPDIYRLARRGGTILLETAQGFDLSLNHGTAYPFVTSRDITPAAAMSEVGLPAQMLKRVWASMRTFPIRVGHLLDESGKVLGESGPFYDDQHELTWEEIQKESGAPESVLERTTVTKRVRRIFTWSDQQFSRFLRVCAPTDIGLNFVNHLDYSILDKSEGPIPTKVEEFVRRIELNAYFDDVSISPKVRLLGTGAGHDAMIDRGA